MQQDELVLERFALASERIAQIADRAEVPQPFAGYFQKTAAFILQIKELYGEISGGKTEAYSLQQWQQVNHALYEDILPEQYDTSYGNPAYAVDTLGEVHGRILSFLYTEIRSMIPAAFEEELADITSLCELFIEVYNCFEEEELPTYRRIQQIVYWHVSDYADMLVEKHVRRAVDPSLDFAVRIITESDLTDMRYLYRYGEYVSENELRTAAFLNSLPQEEIDRMASVYTEGYRIGFILGKKDLSKKKTVNIRYRLGFERMIRRAIENFAQMGLQPVIYRAAAHSVNRRQHERVGYYGAVPNPQFDYDHKGDSAIYLDKAFVERKLGVLRTAYETYKELAYVHAGPALVETFGENPFAPENKDAAYRLSEKQQHLSVELANETMQITNRYIKGEERSFTIIAFPVPEIGDNFEEIFRETVKINTLDYHLYQRIQQTIIDTLDTGVQVHILGKNGNHTDLTVQLPELKDPEKETLFENCVADVNIPVGEVFTSPRLSGTNGRLHVTEVYLNGLCYHNLDITFTDGMITDYTCTNFDTEEANRGYIRENVLFHHDTLPMGEFAIGTNTTAYMVAEKYQIADKLPILIAEKMGPHFAVGDTCYSWAEDTAVFNPDGKEIIARDNEVSLLRKTDVAKAYFGCHTDITIPYRELGLIEVITAEGARIPIIEDGRFVLPGCEELNSPLR
ncbi:Leucyl aminopeptidase (aminopeptidase T) [Marvinbryantia formatexigens]|nr:Leucyl aminopeptidase (aminopeptidase T) [Marvinbryantia formatexigens]